VVHGRDLWPVKVDLSQFEQVIVNLAVNARDAMPDGGQLTVRTSNVAASETAKFAYKGMPSTDYVLVEVTDTGAGIPPDIIDKIFEPFFTTKDVGKGTGLGLSTVMGIVEQSGGTIWVDSKPGKGTAFRIYLPRHATPADDGRAAAATRLLVRGTETILLVEDDDQVRNLVRTILRAHGYAVLEASNAGDALLICEQHEEAIDLLLTDVVMPRMSGRQLAERLAQMRPEMRVLFMSGYTDDAVVRHGVEGSALAFIQKPLTPDALLAKVREVLDSRAAPPAT
jgi:two-component system cell cycle sensor histidine kinase/response regulator CckA